MKIIIIMILTTMVSLSMEQPANETLREWKDKNGTTVKAEYVRTEVESVILRREDGTEFKVSMKSLSDKDIGFVRLQTPPRIMIKVEPSVDTYTVGYLGNDGYDYTVRYEVIEPSVLLRKTTTEPYEATLEMELLLLGRIREVRRYVIVDTVVVPFNFTGKQSYEVYYSGYPVDLRQVRGSWRSGLQYEGYLVIVRDSLGRVVAAKSNKARMERNAEMLSGVETGTMLTDQFKVVKPRIMMREETLGPLRLTP